jgi:hypothetical protein
VTIAAGQDGVDEIIAPLDGRIRHRRIEKSGHQQKQQAQAQHQHSPDIDDQSVLYATTAPLP